MIRKLSGLVLVAIFSLAGAAWAQKAKTSSPSSAVRKAKVTCHGKLDVPMTADAEQAIPLNLIAVLKCGDQVTILSDTQGYTMLVQTSGGKQGYVPRVNLSDDIQAKESVAATRPEAPGPNSRAESEAAQTEPAASSPPKPDSTAQAKDASKLRAYVTDAKTWEGSDGFRGPGILGYSGDPSPEMAEFIKNFIGLCPAVTVTEDRTNASYIVLSGRGGSKKGLGWVEHALSHKADKIEVFRGDGDALLSQPIHSVEEAAKAACAAIEKDAAQPPPTLHSNPSPLSRCDRRVSGLLTNLNCSWERKPLQEFTQTP